MAFLTVITRWRLLAGFKIIRFSDVSRTHSLSMVNQHVAASRYIDVNPTVYRELSRQN
jgi:hypothetical protein